MHPSVAIFLSWRHFPTLLPYFFLHFPNKLYQILISRLLPGEPLITTGGAFIHISVYVKNTPWICALPNLWNSPQQLSKYIKVFISTTTGTRKMKKCHISVMNMINATWKSLFQTKRVLKKWGIIMRKNPLKTQMEVTGYIKWSKS